MNFFQKNNAADLTVHDITAMIRPDTPCWPGKHHVFSHRYAKSTEAGDSVNVSRLDCSMHLGTHVEAPFHKNGKGKKLKAFPLESFMGNAFVIDLTGVESCITLRDIEGVDLAGCDICLLKTRNSELLAAGRLDPDFVHMDEQAATHLAAKSIRAVGIDSLGMDRVDSDIPLIHNIFLDADILVYEALDLRSVSEGKYFFVGLPLKVEGTEASPVRAVLIDLKEKVE